MNPSTQPTPAEAANDAPENPPAFRREIAVTCPADNSKNFVIIEEEVSWQCPACGVIRKSFLRRAETTVQAKQTMLCKEHIIEGCPAYLRNPLRERTKGPTK